MDMQKLIDSLSPNERKILPHLDDSLNDICKKSNLDKTSVLRALEYLQNKKILKLSYDKKNIVELGVNGVLYRSKGLPERRLLNLVDEKRIVPLKEAGFASRLSDEEFKASLGALKKKAFIELRRGNIHLTAGKEDVAKKSFEELLIEALPLEEGALAPEQKFALDSLMKRKNIIEIIEKTQVNIEVSDLGKKLMKAKIKDEDMIEMIDSNVLKSEKNWKGKKFRRYDVESPVPQISGGKRHFVNQAIEHGRKIWVDMGFKEMTGNMVQPSFWNFDALFTAQDHPVREMQDTFFLNKFAKLPDAKLVNAVKDSHEGKIEGSKGWGYKWDADDAKKMVLRTHTTCLSAQTLAKIDKNKLPQKFFALGKCFRNETVDWSHGFEFNQTEGIVVDRNANFRHLLGYLKQFFGKMGFSEVRFRPAYFPYTEPSVEIDVWHPKRKVWLEIGGAGMFRPEVTIPIFGEHIPVLAWGPGFDRVLMDYYKVEDLRELYKNNLTKLRNMKFWVKE